MCSKIIVPTTNNKTDQYINDHNETTLTYFKSSSAAS